MYALELWSDGQYGKAAILRGCMKYRVYGHRHAGYLFSTLDEYRELWDEILDALDSITDQMIIDEFESANRRAKSISEAVNKLIRNELVVRGWASESYIFADEDYGPSARGTWRLDFAKDELSVEVAFNHRSDISWNLIKPTLASELNHVQKAIQTSGGVVVTATQALKAAGGYDSAVGTYEDYVQYLKPLRNMLTAPLAIIGLEPPDSFRIEVMPDRGSSKVGNVVEYAVVSLDGGAVCPRCGCILPTDIGTCPDCGRRIEVGLGQSEKLKRRSR